MKSKIEYGLEGAFKVDLFSGGKMVSTTDYFNNFITPTGLMYPATYAFADCFRFLSLGRSAISHSGAVTLNTLGTTGLYERIGTVGSSEGNTSVDYMGWDAYASGAEYSHCGTVLGETGPRFYRGWFVPSGANPETVVNEAGGGLTITEFMVSPGNAADPTGKWAFSRVVRSLFIPNGHRAIISYQLKVNIRNTGATIFSGGTFATGNAEVSNDNDLVKTWATLSGYYKQAYNGLRYIDNVGITYIPKFGDGMEPSSKNVTKMVWYLSPDNSQFDVNTGGSAQTDTAKAYSADGLMGYVKNIDLRILSNSNINSLSPTQKHALYTDTNPAINTSLPKENISSNIRIGRTSAGLADPLVENYKVADTPGTFTYQTRQNPFQKKVSYATPGVKGFNTTDYIDFGQQAVFTSFTSKGALTLTGQNTITGRKKTITRKSVFSPVNSLGYNTRFGSMVYAFAANTDTVGDKLYYPMVDTLFYDTSGRATMAHYRFITGIALTDRGTGIAESFVYLSGVNGASAFKLGGLKTFQGPTTGANSSGDFFGHVAVTTTFNVPGVGFRCTGIPCSGVITSGQSGNLGSAGGGINVVSGSGHGNTNHGWGAVYGIVASGFPATGWFTSGKADLGLTDHSLRALVEPSETGTLYWPYVKAGNELSVLFTGIKYYDPNLKPTEVVADTGNWFGTGKQVVKSVDFILMDDSHALIPTTGLTGSYGAVTGRFLPVPTKFDVSGYWLTNRQSHGGDISFGAFGNHQLIYTDQTVRLTGYIIPQNITAGKLFGTVWKDGGNIPSNSHKFVIEPNQEPGPMGPAAAGSMPANRINRLFTSIQDRGYPNATGLPFKVGEKLAVFFTGFHSGSGLYVTLFSGTSASLGRGYSYMSGGIELTNFAPPKATYIHAETSGGYGSKLTPNHVAGSFYETGLTPNIGGEYPALSLDNGLELFLDISWSSPCGPNVAGGTCNEPV